MVASSHRFLEGAEAFSVHLTLQDKPASDY